MYDKQSIWFDTMEQKLLTYQDLQKEYVLYMIDLTTEREEEVAWMRKHPADYTFDVFLEKMSLSNCGSLILVENGSEFMRRKTNE